MKNSIKLIVISLLSAFATFAQAHPGHDHSHWSSNMLHSLFYGSLVIAVAAIAFFVARKLQKNKLENS